MPKVIKTLSGEDVVWIIALSDREMENLSIYTQNIKIPSIQTMNSQHKRIRDGRSS